MRKTQRTLLAGICLLATTLCGCGLDLNETMSIVGTWELSKDGFSCKDINVFNADDSFRFVSDEEISTGTYSFEETVFSGSRHQLTLRIVTDNGLVDCMGSTKDNSGDQFTLFVEVQSASEARVFATATEGGESLGLKKID